MVGLALHGLKGLMVFSDKALVRLGLLHLPFGNMPSLRNYNFVLKFVGLPWYQAAVGILSILAFQLGSIILITLMLFGVVRKSKHQ